MAHALEMFLDEAGDAAVRRLWVRIDEAGVPSLADQTHGKHRPHVTLAIAESLSSVSRARLRSVLAEEPIRLDLHTLGTFPGDEGAVFLAVTTNGQLISRHERLHEVLAEDAVEQWEYYLPGSWVPHCTLTQRLSHQQVLVAMGAVLDYEPVTAVVSSVGITNTVTGDVEDIVTL